MEHKDLGEVVADINKTKNLTCMSHQWNVRVDCLSGTY